MRKYLIPILMISLLLASCGRTAVEEERYTVCYLSEDSKLLLENTCTNDIGTGEDEESIEALSDELNNGKDVPVGSLPLLNDDTKIRSAKKDAGVLTVDIGAGYYDLTAFGQLLVRAGITRTYTQLDTVNAVRILVNGKPAVDSDGNEIPVMKASTFVDEKSDGINNYRSTEMTLYFANEDGTELAAEKRTAYYSINTPIEQAVINELIRGPVLGGCLRTLPPDLNVLNVTIQDEICYVNFDDSFEHSSFEMDPQIQIRSIVDSLASVCSVKQVAISVNGSSSVQYKGTVDLEQIFTPDIPESAN